MYSAIVYNSLTGSCRRYAELLSEELSIPCIPVNKAKDLKERTALISFLKENDILAVFHYVPLHSAPAGRKFGRFSGEDKYTTRESERLLRLPLHYNLTTADVEFICDKVIAR